MPARLGHGLYKKIVASQKYFSLYIVQVCLMSQSSDNVVSIHDHLLTVHAHKT